MRLTTVPGSPPTERRSTDSLDSAQGFSKDGFLAEHKQLILTWVQEHEDEIVEARNDYSWGGNSTLECVDERNGMSRAIMDSRIRNRGGVDLDTLDRVMNWGGFGRFPLRDPEECLKVTSEALGFLDVGQAERAVSMMMSVKGVGIARATKVLGSLIRKDLWSMIVGWGML